MKIPFLLKYSGKNTEGYKLVYASTEKRAINKLKKQLWYINDIHVQSATII